MKKSPAGSSSVGAFYARKKKTGVFFLIKAGIEPAGRLLKQPLILE
jgi:hypothetical protein